MTDGHGARRADHAQSSRRSSPYRRNRRSPACCNLRWRSSLNVGADVEIVRRIGRTSGDRPLQSRTCGHGHCTRQRTTAGRRRPAGGRGVGEWRRALASGVFWCAAVLFAGGVAVALIVGGRFGYELWEDRREEQADLAEARRDCAGRFDPEEWGTPQQQFDGCVSERMERWTWRTEVHPIFFVFIAAPWLLYMGITGLVTFLARDYRRDVRTPGAAPR